MSDFLIECSERLRLFPLDKIAQKAGVTPEQARSFLYQPADKLSMSETAKVYMGAALLRIGCDDAQAQAQAGQIIEHWKGHGASERDAVCAVQIGGRFAVGMSAGPLVYEVLVASPAEGPCFVINVRDLFRAAIEGRDPLTPVQVDPSILFVLKETTR